MTYGDSADILAFLDKWMGQNADEIGRRIADDFRKRRIERGITRDQIALKAGVAPANVKRFEQKGLISLQNLIKLAMAMDYLHEVRDIFAAPKYSTMDELLRIRRNQGKKKAHSPKPNPDEKD